MDRSKPAKKKQRPNKRERNKQKMEALALIQYVLTHRKVERIPCSWRQAAKLLNMVTFGFNNEEVKEMVRSRLIHVLNKHEQRQGLELSYYSQKGVIKKSDRTTENKLPKRLEPPHQFRSKGGDSHYQLAPLKLSGVDTQLNPDACNDNEITIGLDFGTSSVKVVVRDLNGNTFLVPFGTSNSAQKYLLPTRVYERNGIFNLEGGNTVWRNLKLSLMSKSSDSEHLVHATAYLALVLRRVRAWIFENYKSLYKSDYLIWGINVGLPAASYDDRKLVNTFKRISLAAANLSADSTEQINVRQTMDYLNWANDELQRIKTRQPTQMPIMSDMVDVVPEIAAQISGYVRSDCWDRQHMMMMLVDIGAGTVDASVFTVMKAEQHQFAFLSSSVEPNGVMNLHRKRVEWIKDKIFRLNGSDPFIKYLDDIYQPTDQTKGIPEEWQQYIKGLKLAYDRDVDENFYASYRGQLYNKTITPGKQSNPRSYEWRMLPFFLCGGGKNMEIYKKIVDLINTDCSNGVVRLKPMIMSPPSNLVAKALKQKDYHRFSVAYGLSYSRDLIGKCIPTADIPPLNRTNRRSKKSRNRKKYTVRV